MKRYFSYIVIAILLGLSVTMEVAAAAVPADITENVKALGPPFASETEASDLTARGCVARDAIPQDRWAIPSRSEFWESNTFIISHPEGWKYTKPADLSWLNWSNTYWFCPPDVVQTLKESGKEISVGTIGGWIVWGVNGILTLLASLGNFVLRFASKLVGAMLGVGSFVNNSMVQAGWPIVQGFVNVGFILALLFIAFATTLRLDNYGARRLLPRLLIAALLLNFSLVIGGIIIDASRLAMAVVVSIVGNTKLIDIGTDLVKNSGIMTMVFEETSFTEDYILKQKISNNSWQAVFMVLEATVFMWVLAIGMLVIAVGLFMRYIMLILLLIVSPAAFLAYVLPGGEPWAKKWWQSFLKWVLYGPAALFVLVLLVKIGGNLGNMINNDPNNTIFSQLLQLSVTTAMLMAAAKAGNMLGTAGGTGLVDFVTKRGKQAAKFAYNNPVKAGAIIGTVATGGIGGAVIGAGAAMAGKRVSYQARDFGKGIVKPVNKALGRGEFNARDEKGNLKPGKKSWGSSAGSAVGNAIAPAGKPVTGAASGAGMGAAAGSVLGPVGAVAGAALGGVAGAAYGTWQSRKQATESRDHFSNIQSNTSRIEDIKADSLKDTDAVKKLSKVDVTNLAAGVISSTSKAAQLRVVQNIEIIRKMEQPDRDRIIDRTGDKDVVRALNDTMRKIADEENSKK